MKTTTSSWTPARRRKFKATMARKKQQRAEDAFMADKHQLVEAALFPPAQRHVIAELSAGSEIALSFGEFKMVLRAKKE